MEKMKMNDDDLDLVTGGTQLPHIITKGDTLADLAARYHCSVEQICKWNNIQNPSQIVEGQKLIFKF